MIDIGRHQREYLDTVLLDIKNDLNSRGMNATFNTNNSLRVVENQYLNAQLRGAHSIPFIETGNNSDNPSNPSFWPGISVWMRAKNIQPKRGNRILPATPVNIKRASYAIALSIVDHGTKYQNNQPGIDLQEHLTENMPDLLNGIGSELLTSFTDRF